MNQPATEMTPQENQGLQLKVPADLERFTMIPKDFREAMDFAKFLATADMIPKAFKGKPADILLAVQMGVDVGLSPPQALQNIAVINGRPLMWGDAVLGVCRGSSVFDGERFLEELPTHDNPVARCQVARKGEPPVIRTFSKQDAETAQLWKKEGPWQTYPMRMLQMRARAFALRDAFPDVLKGIRVREDYAGVPEQDERVISNVADPALPPASAANRAKAKVKAKKDTVKEDTEFEAIMASIEGATDLEELKALGEHARDVIKDKTKKTLAREAWTKRRDALSAALSPTPDESTVLRKFKEAKNQEDFDLASDLMRSLPNTEVADIVRKEAAERLGIE
ncbi:MAG: hypothetical protein V3V08_07140 [Nannocystaceae bacterium]